MGNKTSKINAVCVLSNKNINGVIYFHELENGNVKIHGEISGLSPGLHGFHIHQFGNLT